MAYLNTFSLKILFILNEEIMIFMNFDGKKKKKSSEGNYDHEIKSKIL